MKRRTVLVGAAAAALARGFARVASAGRAPAVPIIDLPSDERRRVVVAQAPGQFLGPASATLLRDGKTILAVYALGDAAPSCGLKVSRDGGRTWTARLAMPGGRLTLPGGAATIHRVADSKGAERLVLFVSRPRMMLAVSEDHGLTWSSFRELAGGRAGLAPPKSLVSTGKGRCLAAYYGQTDGGGEQFALQQIASDDGGLAWGAPRIMGPAVRYSRALACEPALIPSVDGKQILCLGVESLSSAGVRWMVSDDQGETWSEPQPLPVGLQGDRHLARYAPDGRLVIHFRDSRNSASPTSGQYVGWIGRYEDVLDGREGLYRLLLQRHYGGPEDHGGCALEVSTDGTVVAVCEAACRPGDANSIVSVRYRIQEIDRLARSSIPAASLRGILRRDMETAQASRPKEVEVFASGERGVHTYRIPVLLTSNKGTLLAFCDARVERPQDAPNNIDLVMKRSFDGGRTWSGARVLLDAGPESAANACGLVDRQTGAIWLFYLRAPVWEGDPSDEDAAKEARDRVMTVWAIRSDDDGETWSSPVDLTSQFKRTPDWVGVAVGPGIGIQTRSGRLILPCYRGPRDRWTAFIVYSDDHGRSWLIGGDANAHTNECQAVELADGSLMLNMRSYRDKRCRAVQTSSDGGRTWYPVRDDPALIEPVCQASFIRYTDIYRQDRNRLLFANPTDVRYRRRMVVRLSYDEGRTWPEAKVLHYGPSAYSCLAVLPDMSVGLLYEKNEYRCLAFTRFTPEWLTDGRDRVPR